MHDPSFDLIDDIQVVGKNNSGFFLLTFYWPTYLFLTHPSIFTNLIANIFQFPSFLQIYDKSDILRLVAKKLICNDTALKAAKAQCYLKSGVQFTYMRCKLHTRRNRIIFYFCSNARSKGKQKTSCDGYMTIGWKLPNFFCSPVISCWQSC